MSTAAQLRAQGQSDVIAADTAAHRGYADLVVEGVEWWGSDGQTFTADHVRTFIGLNYPDAQPHSPNLLPAVIGGLAAAGRIEAVGWAKSPRTSRRSGWGRVWRLTPKAPRVAAPCTRVEEAVAGGRVTTPAPSARPAGLLP